MTETSPIFAEIAAIHELYRGLAPWLDPENGLGGRLLYAAELDDPGCRLVRAANIAGAASLAAAPSPAQQRQIIREGVADFLVTDLSEALRILKNEIRKRQPVAVAVAATPESLAAEMLSRGVQPDLLPPASAESLAAFIALGAEPVEPAPLPPGSELLILTGPPEGFEAQALDLIPASDYANRRWLRLSPRYLGPRARRLRFLLCDPATAAQLRAVR